MWEAFEHAGYAGLDNLIAIVDVNRLGQRGPTMHEWDTASLAARASACGWHVNEIDGHDLASIEEAYEQALGGRPPGGDLRPHQEGLRRRGSRGQGEPARQAARRPRGGYRRAGRASARSRSRSRRRPSRGPSRSPTGPVERPTYEVGEKVATRGAYGDALAWIGSIDERVVAIDGEVGNSTYAERFAAKHPDRFFEMYIAEQQMVAAAIGLQTRGWKPFASSFGAFLSRAYDFVRMGSDLRRRPEALRLPRRRLDRPRRSLADGARGHRLLPRRLRQRRPLPVRRQPGGGAARRDARAPRLQLHAHDPRSEPDPLPGRRGVPDRRQPHAALQRRRPGHPDRRRDHPARMPRRRGRRWPRTASPPG